MSHFTLPRFRPSTNDFSGVYRLEVHHLQSHSLPPPADAVYPLVTGQCSSGDRALAEIGHPQPVSAGRSTTCSRNGLPQYAVLLCNVYNGQRAHTSARASQFSAVGRSFTDRNLDDAYFAAARESDLNTGDNVEDEHVKHAMPIVIGRPDAKDSAIPVPRGTFPEQRPIILGFPCLSVPRATAFR